MAVRPKAFQKNAQREELSLFQAVRQERKERAKRNREEIAYEKSKEAEEKRLKEDSWAALCELMEKKVVRVQGLPACDIHEDTQIPNFYMIVDFREAVRRSGKFAEMFDKDTGMWTFSVIQGKE